MEEYEFVALQRRLETYLQSTDSSHYEAGSLRSVHRGNHIIWRGEYHGGLSFALRMADPTHYRAGEWISASQEYALLEALEQTRLVPRPYGVIIEGFEQPFVMMEWVDGVPLTGVKDDARKKEYLDSVARAIGLLNQQDIRPERFPFIPRVSGWRAGGNVTRYLRLLDACRRMPQIDVALWAARILPIVMRFHYVSRKCRWFFDDAPWCFNHDGLHVGNVFVREDGSLVFLDWDRVSYRKNPAYTLSRFAASLYLNDAIPKDFGRLVERFYEAFGGASDFENIAAMAARTFMERVCADLVYLLWDFTRNPANRARKMPDRLHAVLQFRLDGIVKSIADF